MSAKKESVFWLFLSVCSLAISLGLAYRAGLVMGRHEQPQLLSSYKESMQIAKARQNQITAVADALSELIYDPRTHAHTRLQLERVLERCSPRC